MYSSRTKKLFMEVLFFINGLRSDSDRIVNIVNYKFHPTGIFNECF
jgi:hypothetical protein